MSNHDHYKRKLSYVLNNYFATNQTSEYERKSLFGPFVDLVAHNTTRRYPKAAKIAIHHTAKDFHSMLCTMAISNELASRKTIIDPSLTALTIRVLILTFFSDIRSMFDYMLLATLIIFKKEIATQKGTFAKKLNAQLKRTNFTTFLHDIKTHRLDATNCFGSTLVRLWISCTWFNRFNSWRNELVHRGGFLAVHEKQRDLFRIETIRGIYPLNRRYLPSTIFGPQKSVSFSLFSGLYSGLMIDLLNNWTKQLWIKTGLAGINKAYGGRGGTACEQNIKKMLPAL